MDLMADTTNQILILILIIVGIVLLILLYRERRMTKQIKELKSGYENFCSSKCYHDSDELMWV